MFFYLYKIIARIWGILSHVYCFIVTWIKLKGNRAEFSTFSTRGIPYIMMSRKGKRFIIGDGFSMNNGVSNNPIGCPQPCTFFVGDNSEIIIGNNVGISQTALISHCSISIGDNVKIGGGTCIYTTDFHTLNPVTRASENDQRECVKKPVTIEDNVFIGAHSIILKGVTIGKNTIVGAGSVVTKSIPTNEIWAGNPAKMIRKLDVE